MYKNLIKNNTLECIPKVGVHNRFNGVNREGEGDDGVTTVMDMIGLAQQLEHPRRPLCLALGAASGSPRHPAMM